MTAIRGATAEGLHGPTAGARAVLDIGPHAGALVVYTDRHLVGGEIEIRPHGACWQGTHTEVRERRVAGAVVHAGLFSSLPPGDYDLRLRPAAAGHHAHGPESAGAPHTHDATDAGAPHAHDAANAAEHDAHEVTDSGRAPLPVEITVMVAAGGVCEASLF